MVQGRLPPYVIEGINTTDDIAMANQTATVNYVEMQNVSDNGREDYDSNPCDDNYVSTPSSWSEEMS
jgi:hypothetical protein